MTTLAANTLPFGTYACAHTTTRVTHECTYPTQHICPVSISVFDRIEQGADGRGQILDTGYWILDTNYRPPVANSEIPFSVKYCGTSSVRHS